MGEGGAVLPLNAKWKRVAESIRDWGRDCWCDPGKDNTCKKRFGWQLGDLPNGYDHKYTYSNIGYNLKVTDMQASIGMSQLKKLPQFIESRRANYQALRQGIQNSPILSEFLQPVSATPGTDPSWFGFPIHLREQGLVREDLTQKLEEKKVGTRLLFGGNLTRQPAYQSIDYRISGDLSVSDQVMKNTFWIGLHPSISKPMIDYMLATLEESIQSLKK